jgi:hypothetical protein
MKRKKKKKKKKKEEIGVWGTKIKEGKRRISDQLDEQLKENHP